MSVLEVLGNVLWLIFGGLLAAIAFLLAGVLCCITVIGIPLGIQYFQFARLALSPFGYDVDYGSMGSGSVILNVIWILLCGLELAVAFVIMGLVLCVTIIGIPFGLQMFKFAKLSLTPFGAKIRPAAVCR